MEVILKIRCDEWIRDIVFGISWCLRMNENVLDCWAQYCKQLGSTRASCIGMQAQDITATAVADSIALSSSPHIIPILSKVHLSPKLFFGSMSISNKLITASERNISVYCPLRGKEIFSATIAREDKIAFATTAVIEGADAIVVGYFNGDLDVLLSLLETTHTNIRCILK